MAKKGPSFERDQCRLWSLWWTNGEADDVFWRTSGSGARATTRSKKGVTTKNSYGDMGALDSVGEPLTNYFLFEFKRGYTGSSFLDYVDMKNKKKAELVNFWLKAEEDRANADRHYTILVLRRNRREEVMATNAVFFNELGSIIGVKAMKKIMDPGLVLQFSNTTITVFSQKTFLEVVKPERIKLMIGGN